MTPRRPPRSPCNTRVAGTRARGACALLLRVLLAFLVLGTARLARAEPSSQQPAPVVLTARTRVQPEALRHYQRGLAYYDAGDQQQALSEFSVAYALSRNFQLLFNIAQLHYELSHFARARESLQRYLRDGGVHINDERRQRVSTQLRALEQLTAVLILDLDGAPAILDVQGRRLTSSGTEQAVVVDPGEVQVVARRSGFRAVARSIWAAPGHTVRLALAFGRPEPAASQRPPMPYAQVWSFGAAGLLGVGAIGTGVASWLATEHYAELRGQLASGSAAATRRRLDRQRALVRSLAITTEVLALGSLASAGLGLYLSLAKEPAPSSASLALGPGYVELSGSF